MRIDFYHLDAWPLDRALPKLLEKVISAGQRALVVTASEERAQTLNTLLWTYDAGSWLPHGTKADGHEPEQPILIGDTDDNLNNADILVLTEGMDSAHKHAFSRCLDLFDGTNADALEAARDRWKTAKADGHELHYWQQTQSGGWSEQAQG